MESVGLFGKVINPTWGSAMLGRSSGMRFYNDPKFVWVAVGDGNFRVVRRPSRNIEMKDDVRMVLPAHLFWKSDFLRARLKLSSNIAKDRASKLISTFCALLARPVQLTP